MGELIDVIAAEQNAKHKDRFLWHTDRDAYSARRREELRARSERISEVREAFWSFIGERAVTEEKQYTMSKGYLTYYEPIRLGELEESVLHNALWALPYVSRSEEQKKVTWPVRDGRGKIDGDAMTTMRGEVVVQNYGFAVLEGSGDEAPTETLGELSLLGLKCLRLQKLMMTNSMKLLID